MTVKIEGMGCMHCVAKVKKALEESGVSFDSVEIGSAKVADGSDVETVKAAVEKAGFTVASVE